MVLLLAPPVRWPVDEVRAGIEVHGRHADLGKAELVRAVKVALVGKLIGLDHAPLLLGNQNRNLVDRRLAQPDVGHIVRVSPDIAAVIVDVGCNLSRWKRRISRVKLRAQEALLLGADQVDEYRAARRFG